MEVLYKDPASNECRMEVVKVYVFNSCKLLLGMLKEGEQEGEG